ncbi:unnamed protein product [Candidula unifasciata]|uniref:Uncharacterized protein n=1 Tax=Candidula unifasciata TaxID=100452 RepID=A0A8S3Z6B0_9EUPU|nr:unnamed protein product [Candidula unifasciata]
MQNYHRLFLASEEGYDKLTNLSGSGGAEGLKEKPSSDPFVDSKDTGSSNSVTLSLSSIRFGDISDEDSYPSSGSESRESSAGSVRTRHPCPPPLETHLITRRLLQRQNLNSSQLSSLELEIPAAAKTSRDSGIGSGDPSPNTSNSPSSQNVDSMVNGCGQMRHNIVHSYSIPEAGTIHFHHKLDKRSRSAAMLAISPSRLREINDPVQQILHQLHKIVYITQLPPTLSPNPNRRIVEQYKRALFATGSNGMNLKSEMRKLIQGSQDIIDMNLGSPEYIKRSSLGSELDSPLDPDKPATLFYDPDYKDVGITYEYLQTILEALLEESGYYTGKGKH